MKVFNEARYEYLGVEKFRNKSLHAFREIQHNNTEVVLVDHAKFIKKDGMAVYYDPINTGHKKA